MTSEKWFNKEVYTHWNNMLSDILYHTNTMGLELKYEWMKSSTHYACAAPQIDGLGYEYVFTRGLHASWSWSFTITIR